MGRKVFISVLGTGLYNSCRYVAEGFSSSETRFIQHATLEYLGAKNWDPGSKGYILLTEKARKDNWTVEGNIRRNVKTNEELPYKGLHDVLQDAELPFCIEDISIPDGKDEHEMWQIFETVYRLLDDGDELHFDLTHSFRYLPMLMLVLGNYAKFLKKASVCSITYGNYEARETSSNQAPIVNLLPLSSLQDWTFATADFLKNGYADRLVELSNRGLSPLLKNAETRQDENVKKLNALVAHLKNFSSEIQICRGMDIVNGGTVASINNDIHGLQKIVIPQLDPVLQKISISVSGFSESQDVRNMFYAAQWCYDNLLYQQSTTFLEEGVISFFCSRHHIPLDCRQKRELITSAFNILANNRKEEEWKVEPDLKEILRHVVDDISNNYPALIKPFNSVVDLRNDYNHCGMRENRAKATSLKSKINTRFHEIIPILYSEGFHDILPQPAKSRFFINLSNHPSSLWDQKQREAAAHYGEIVDLSFPLVSPESSHEEIEQLAEQYASEIAGQGSDADLTVHVMGEMTLTYAIVSRLKSRGIRCVASTTERHVAMNEEGTKLSEFSFVGFREY